MRKLLSKRENVSSGVTQNLISSQTFLPQLQEAFLRKIWSMFTAVALIAAPLSLLRIPRTGWDPVYGFHICVVVFLVLGHIFRDNIPHKARLAAFVICMGGVGVWGMYVFGILGAGLWSLVICGLIVSLSHSIRMGLTIFAGTGLLYIGAMFLFTSGYKTPAFDVSTYFYSPAPWLTVLISALVLPTLVIVAIHSYQKAVGKLIYKIERQRDELAHYAMYDELTGLPSRRLAYDRLEMAMRRARRSEAYAAVFFIDLDGFKKINDAHGHAVGDEVLCETSARLEQILRRDDTVARLGGDEFLVILDGIPGEHIAENIARRILENIREPIVTRKNDEVFVGASLGIALYPHHGDDVHALIERADSAMYRAKKAGKNTYMFPFFENHGTSLFQSESGDFLAPSSLP